MLLLRKITGAGLQMNFIIASKTGEGYNFVEKEANPKEFEEMKKLKSFNEKTYAFITCGDGSVVIPLYEGQKNYLMANGRTVDNLSQR